MRIFAQPPVAKENMGKKNMGTLLRGAYHHFLLHAFNNCVASRKSTGATSLSLHIFGDNNPCSFC